jgi:DNA-binding NarL/FixJ family response regulator
MSAVTPAAAKPRVFLVDDHLLVLSGVRAELGDAVYVVGEASEVDAAIEMIRERRPDVVLLDVHMPGGGGRAVIEAVTRAGARGYVTKTISGPELVEAVLRVADGDAVFSPRLAGFVLDAFSADHRGPVDPELDQLTGREKEVLRHLARGYSYKEIARQLAISVKTVETHASAVLRKLQLTNRHQLSRWATDRRLV